MLAKRKKISKKEIKEDKLITYYSKALEFVETYSKQLIIGIGVLAVIVAGTVIYQNKITSDNIAATTALSKIIPNYEQKNYQSAIEGQPGTDLIGLKSIADNYGSSEQGEVAKLYLGNSYYYSGKYDEALKVYGDISGSQPSLSAAAFAGQGACFEAKNDYEQAAKEYEKAAHVYKFNALNSSYLLHSGIDYIKAKNYNAAKTVLNLVKKEYKTSQEAKDVDKYLDVVELKTMG